MKRLAILLLVLTGSPFSLAEPTTRPAAPTTRPAAPTTKPTALKPDRDSILIDRPAFSSKLLIPRSWFADKTYLHDSSLRYELRNGSGGSTLAVVHIQFFSEAESDAPLVEQVAKWKERWKPKGEITMIRNEATTVGGSPAWLFVYDEAPIEGVRPLGAPVPKANANAKPSGNRTMKVLAAYRDARVELEFQSSQADFATRSRAMQRVLDSYTWFDAEDTKIETAALRMTASPKWNLNPLADEWYKDQQPFIGGQTYENRGISVNMTLLTKPATAGNSSLDAAFESVRKQQASQRAGITMSAPTDTALGNVAAKSMLIDFTMHSSCGATFPMKQMYTVAVKDGKVNFTARAMKGEGETG